MKDDYLQPVKQFSSPQLVDRVLQRVVAIQQIAAPPFDEAARSVYMLEQFRSEGLADVAADELGNVYARLPGSGSARPVVFSAHLDTVFPRSTDLSVRRESDRIYGPGIGDNSLGLAGLVVLVWGLRQSNSQPAGDIWLVANVGEEGLGDLRGMRAVVQRFGAAPLAYIVLEGMSLGQIYHRALGVQRYRITLRTAGGHSWVDYGRPSANHELAALVTRLAAFPLPAQPRSSLNVGVMSGGTGVNVIAAEAHLELDLRSEDSFTLAELARRVELLCSAACRKAVDSTADVHVNLEIIGQRPAGQIIASHPLVQLAECCLRAQGITPHLTIGSTDANIPLSQGLPAITLGITTGHGAHTPGEYINTPPVAQGLAQLLALAENIFQELA